MINVFKAFVLPDNTFTLTLAIVLCTYAFANFHNSPDFTVILQEYVSKSSYFPKIHLFPYNAYNRPPYHDLSQTITLIVQYN